MPTLHFFFQDKVEDIGEIMAYGVISTPGAVIDGQVVMQEVFLNIPL